MGARRSRHKSGVFYRGKLSIFWSVVRGLEHTAGNHRREDLAIVALTDVAVTLEAFVVLIGRSIISARAVGAAYDRLNHVARLLSRRRPSTSGEKGENQHAEEDYLGLHTF